MRLGTDALSRGVDIPRASCTTSSRGRAYVKHGFDNLIALCPNDHARAERGEVDRQALRAYKRNLAVLTSP